MTFDRKKFAPFVRNFVFGVEDSLVSTVGLLSGVAASGAERSTIIVTGVVLIFVEAFSMGVGSVLSDNSTKEFKSGEEVPLAVSVKGGVVMLVSYFIAGLIPLAPYLFLPNGVAFSASIWASLLGLYLLGYASAKMAGVNPLKESIQMFLLGGAAVGIGVAVGTLLK